MQRLTEIINWIEQTYELWSTPLTNWQADLKPAFNRLEDSLRLDNDVIATLNWFLKRVDNLVIDHDFEKACVEHNLVLIWDYELESYQVKS